MHGPSYLDYHHVKLDVVNARWDNPLIGACGLVRKRLSLLLLRFLTPLYGLRARVASPSFPHLESCSCPLRNRSHLNLKVVQIWQLRLWVLLVVFVLAKDSVGAVRYLQ